ncbi:MULTISPECIES: nucleotidyltransferase family protein [unclassified Nodularia (in: cyanobacteria)]|uniref:nucleotidyltransferase family protein n=1 Tax=unclassified Nodularia (in: cyanobacteria) TaxID=2656917 RepID=UPI00187EB0D5|nr:MULTISPECIES: nucleotidyltransferase family protein [unclassified Nodularia (in: cyanobacteria)]MBE9201572.1 nucleotidyltransferase family protein [Nodularia sp. LEGE 06071]MCC2694465.1 nucleotidyltransferase family protein [Nodularia sp. LEGE 04288]
MSLDWSNRLAYFDSYRLKLSHKQLLKATLLKEQAMLTAWQDWRDSVDIETLDSSSYLLLPQLYQNLLAHGVDDADMARLKGIYRRHWYANQLQLKSLTAILSSLKDIGIEAIVLGDATWGGIGKNQIENYRPISSFHLLLDGNCLDTAIEHLLSLNWHSVDGSKQQFKELRHNCDSSLNLRLYLQEHLFWAIPQDYTDGQVWHYATADWSSEAGWRLSATDQFLDGCARMFFRQRTKSSNPQIHRIADAFLLIANLPNNDWIRLITQAQRYQMILPVRNMLQLLQQLVSVELPSWVLPALWQMPIANTEWVKYRVLDGDRRSMIRSMIVQSLELLK